MNLTPVESSNIHSIGYDPETRVMRVRFHDYTHKGNGVVQPGRVYEHVNVSPEDYAAFMAAESKGVHYGRHIRGAFEPRRVEDG